MSQKLKKIVITIKNYILSAKVELIVLLAVLIFDLVTKSVVASNLQPNQSVTWIQNFLHIYYTHNKNAAFSFDFGLGSLVGQKGVTTIFIIVTFIALLAYCVLLYLLRHRRKFLLIMIALVIAGALGNLVDRMTFGYVRDFVYIEYFGKDIAWLGGTGFAIFNMADVALVSGFMGAIIYILFMYTKDTKRLESKNKKTTTDTIECTAINIDDTTDTII